MNTLSIIVGTDQGYKADVTLMNGDRGVHVYLYPKEPGAWGTGVTLLCSQEQALEFATALLDGVVKTYAGLIAPPADVTPPIVTPPPADVTPPPADVTPPPADVTPPPADVTPPIVTPPVDVTPPAPTPTPLPAGIFKGTIESLFPAAGPAPIVPFDQAAADASTTAPPAA